MKEIVLIEDSDSDAAQLQRVLNRLEIANPIRRFTAAEAALAYLDHSLQIAAITPPLTSIILIDLLLPGMSGLDLLEAMAGRRGFDQTLRIVLTNLSDIRMIQRAYSLGARSFLIKPVQPADLHEVVETFPGYWSFTPQIASAF